MSDAEQFEYPALYTSADAASAEAQRLTLNLIRVEYAALFCAAVLLAVQCEGQWPYIAYIVLFSISLAALARRIFEKPQQGWYQSRALAESIKTSSWRYCMRAEPFGDAEALVTPRNEFRAHLEEILKANSQIAGRFAPETAAGDQITGTMAFIRAMSFDQRKRYYANFRIKNQRDWYTKKAVENRRFGRRWGWAAASSYGLAIFFAISRLAWPDSNFWPIEPLIVFASSVIGWVQVKKYSELSASYTLTAHEIGLLEAKLATIKESEFSDFINEAEQAFSREHTQWVARQQS